jgi:DNA repair protein RecO
VSYHIYTTKGLVLAARPLREADRTYAILTRDLGLIWASASGVRKEGSKLRGALEPFVISQISLVRGKEHWRITSAETLRTILPKAETARPLALLERLVAGEAGHPELFDIVEEHLDSSETMLVAHALHELGYLKREDLDLGEKELILAINEGLRQSHLA